MGDTGKAQLPEQEGCCRLQEGFTSLFSGVVLSCRCCHPFMMVVGITQEFLHGERQFALTGSKDMDLNKSNHDT